MSKLLRQLRISNLASAEDFEAANRRQQIYGGSFDTVLLELRILEPLALDEQLAQSSGLPTVPPALLLPGAERPWDAIAPALVDLGWAMPLSRQHGRVQVGVHPEIPDEHMDLLRDQPGLELMVTAECCLARLGSERTGSLTPQRYAVLAAAYVRGIGGSDHRPLVEGAGAPWKQSSVPRKSDGTLPEAPRLDRVSPPHPSASASGPILPPPASDPAGAPPSWGRRSDAGPPDAQGAVRNASAPAAAIERIRPPESFSIPDAGSSGRGPTFSAGGSQARGSFSFGPPSPSSAPASTRAQEGSGVPSPLAASKSRSRPKIEVYDPTDLRRRFEATKDRDEITDTLLIGASLLIERVLLLAVRKTGLKWLAANASIEPSSESVIAMSETLHAAIHNGARYGRCIDLPLRIAVGQDTPVPCALLPVQVADRSVLAVYVDAAGAELDDDDIESVRDLTRWAGVALTRVVREAAEARKQGAKRVSAPASTSTTAEPASKQDADSLPSWALPNPRSPTQDGSTAIPSLIAKPRDPAASAAPPPLSKQPGSGPLVVTPRPGAPEKLASKTRTLPPTAAGTATPSATISPKVPRLIDSAPPRSTTLISTNAPNESGTRGLAPTSLSAPPIRELGAPVQQRPGEHDAAKPRAASTSATPVAIPPVRTPAPPIRGGAAATLPGEDPPPVRMPPRRDGTLSPQPHKNERPRPASSHTPIPASAIDDTLIPTHAPVPPVRNGAPPIRTQPAAGVPPVRTSPPASRSSTMPGTAKQLTPLGSPLAQPPSRGRLVLDEEDRHDDSAERSSEQIPREVLDRTIDAAFVDPTAIPALLELGRPALSRLAARFPGPLDVLRRDLNNLPPLSAHGPLIRLVVQLGQRISPMIRELLEHPDTKVRFYAAFTFQELRDEDALDALATRAFDPDGEVRAIAMRVLETYSRTSTFGQRIAPIRSQLSNENMTRQIHAARAVGTLRDVEAVPALMLLLDHQDKRVRDIGLESLCSITGQQLGSRSARWRAWFESNHSYHRVEWIIAALSHKDAQVRAWASIELRRITGQPYALPVDGTKRERDQVIRQWIDWWQRQGREVYGVR